MSRKIPRGLELQIKKSFDNYDTDGSGELDPFELQELLNDIADHVKRPHLTTKEMHTALKIIDENGDGEVQYIELLENIGKVLDVVFFAEPEDKKKEKKKQDISFLLKGKTDDEITMVEDDPTTMNKNYIKGLGKQIKVFEKMNRKKTLNGISDIETDGFMDQTGKTELDLYHKKNSMSKCGELIPINSLINNQGLSGPGENEENCNNQTNSGNNSPRSQKDNHQSSSTHLQHIVKPVIEKSNPIGVVEERVETENIADFENIDSPAQNQDNSGFINATADYSPNSKSTGRITRNINGETTDNNKVLSNKKARKEPNDLFGASGRIAWDNWTDFETLETEFDQYLDQLKDIDSQTEFKQELKTYMSNPKNIREKYFNDQTSLQFCSIIKLVKEQKDKLLRFIFLLDSFLNNASRYIKSSQKIRENFATISQQQLDKTPTSYNENKMVNLHNRKDFCVQRGSSCESRYVNKLKGILNQQMGMRDLVRGNTVDNGPKMNDHGRTQVGENSARMMPLPISKNQNHNGINSIPIAKIELEIPKDANIAHLLGVKSDYNKNYSQNQSIVFLQYPLKSECLLSPKLDCRPISSKNGAKTGQLAKRNMIKEKITPFYNKCTIQSGKTIDLPNTGKMSNNGTTWLSRMYNNGKNPKFKNAQFSQSYYNDTQEKTSGDKGETLVATSIDKRIIDCNSGSSPLNLKAFNRPIASPILRQLNRHKTANPDSTHNRTMSPKRTHVTEIKKNMQVKQIQTNFISKQFQKLGSRSIERHMVS